MVSFLQTLAHFRTKPIPHLLQRLFPPGLSANSSRSAKLSLAAAENCKISVFMSLIDWTMSEPAHESVFERNCSRLFTSTRLSSASRWHSRKSLSSPLFRCCRCSMTVVLLHRLRLGALKNQLEGAMFILQEFQLSPKASNFS